MNINIYKYLNHSYFPFSVNTYSTNNLPMNSGDGRIAFDTFVSVPVYFHDGK
jgi:hypothetical protein